LKAAGPFRALVVALALGAGLLLLVAGPGHRLGLWDYRTGFTLIGAASYGAIAAGVLAIFALAIPALRAHWAGTLVAALIVAATTAYLPWQWRSQAQSVPRIHDISTDTDNPPPFVAVLPRRAGAPNPAAYGGKEIAEQQRKGYPDIQPRMLALAPPAAFARAREAAQGMGWEIVAADPAAGRLEATDTTSWFGFKDDIVIRVAPAGGGSRVDVRSKSRVGRSDMGMNAKRVRAYLAKLGGPQ
jgi:uncharacterized protein (DUF1499 family)